MPFFGGLLPSSSPAPGSRGRAHPLVLPQGPPHAQSHAGSLPRNLAATLQDIETKRQLALQQKGKLLRAAPPIPNTQGRALAGLQPLGASWPVPGRGRNPALSLSYLAEGSGDCPGLWEPRGWHSQGQRRGCSGTRAPLLRSLAFPPLSPPFPSTPPPDGVPPADPLSAEPLQPGDAPGRHTSGSDLPRVAPEAAAWLVAGAFLRGWGGGTASQDPGVLTNPMPPVGAPHERSWEKLAAPGTCIYLGCVGASPSPWCCAEVFVPVREGAGAGIPQGLPAGPTAPSVAFF